MIETFVLEISEGDCAAIAHPDRLSADTCNEALALICLGQTEQ